jgi:uncharacterized LabA/DUF88 family protein
VKAAILIDGGYFLERLAQVRPDIVARDPAQVDRSIGQLVHSHLEQLNKTACAPNQYSLLYRCFYYDAQPYLRKGHLPISKRAVDYAKSDEAKFRLKLFEHLRKRSHFAVRLGEVRRERAWVLSEEAQDDLLNKRRVVDDLSDADFHPGFRQKAVDMRIGIDIASISLKKQADTIVLIAGDSDFVPAAKLARREGVRIVLDPLWRSVEDSLFEHIDALRSGFPRPKANNAANNAIPVVEVNDAQEAD